MKEVILSWSPNTMRLLRIGLMNHDSFTVEAVRERITERLGPDFAEELLQLEVTYLMSKGWSLFDKDGEPSPLLE